MKSDKIGTRRILIFLALSFIPTWALAFLYKETINEARKSKKERSIKP